MPKPPLQQLVRQGMQLQMRGDLERAGSIYQQVLRQEPKHPDALHLYGLVCHQQGNHETAIEFIRKAIGQAPGQAVLHNNLGDALCRAGRYREAVIELDTALDLKPGYAGAHQNLASAHSRMGKHATALEHARQAVQLDDSRPGAWFDLGLILLDHVLLEESVVAFRRALSLQPAYPRAATSLLYTLNLLPGLDVSKLAAEHVAVAAKAFGARTADENTIEPGERTRIGYVSGDFRSHAVNYFFEPVLEHHDRSRFEIVCYSDVREPDQVSKRLAKLADHWRDISNAGDERVLEQIKTDRIDILVDLTGHTKHNRLALFARKPAPRQVSWLGFPNTTGLAAMDYRVVDHCTAPLQERFTGSEELIRLPDSFTCFRPPQQMPAVPACPHQGNGYVTLGCLHKLEKLNDEVIGLWASILRENPGTKLLFARDQLSDWQQQRLQSRFRALGIGDERLQMRRLMDPEAEFLECFGDIDILLDTFPWSGHTLACCGLFLGVPVVTLRGDRHAGRMVASMLETLDLGELIARDIDDYAGLVGQLCADPQRLSAYRAELRGRFESSPLRDETGFTWALEEAFLKIVPHQRLRGR